MHTRHLGSNLDFEANFNYLHQTKFKFALVQLPFLFRCVPCLHGQCVGSSIFLHFWINFPQSIMWLPIIIDAFSTTWLIWSQTNIIVMFMVSNPLCCESILHDCNWEMLGSFERLLPHINGLVGLIIIGLVVWDLCASTDHF